MNTLLDCCTNAVQILEKLQSYIRESQITNWQDTINVFIVCAAICFIVRYGVRRYFRYKMFESNKHEELEKLKRSWEVEDIERKQTAELKKKLMDFLEKNTAPGRYIEDKDKTVNELKEFDSKESQYYISVIKAFINKKQIPNQPLNPNVDEEQE